MENIWLVIMCICAVGIVVLLLLFKYSCEDDPECYKVDLFEKGKGLGDGEEYQ